MMQRHKFARESLRTCTLIEHCAGQHPFIRKGKSLLDDFANSPLTLLQRSII